MKGIVEGDNLLASMISSNSESNQIDPIDPSLQPSPLVFDMQEDCQISKCST
jgi:hypothetical protein